MTEFYPNIPTIEGMPFNPDRKPKKPLSPEELTKREQESEARLAIFHEAFEEYAVLLVQESRGRNIRRPVVEIGQKVGKLWLRCVEKEFMFDQMTMVRRLDSTVGRSAQEHQGLHFDSFLSGFKGEFATGVMLDHSGLDVTYPPRDWDTQEKTDLVANFQNGKQIRVQSKTLSLPEKFNREDMKEPLPVFTLLQNEQDLASFKDKMSVLPTNIDNPDDPVQRLLNEADALYQLGQEKKFNPVFCLLANSEASDFFVASARPKGITEKQADDELMAIYDRLDATP